MRQLHVLSAGVTHALTAAALLAYEPLRLRGGSLSWCTAGKDRVRKVCCGGGKCWLFILWAVAACMFPATLAGPTTSPPPHVVEEELLDQIAEQFCPHADEPGRIDTYERYVTSSHPTSELICYPATGHSLAVTIQRSAGSAEALAELESVAPEGPVHEIEGFPSSGWQEDHPSFPGGREEVRVRLLQAGPWLIRIESFDDTHFLIAPDPRQVSVAVVRAVKERGLPPDAEGSPP
jgi:hypothetical protein